MGAGADVGVSLVLSGPTGVGKSALLEWAAARAVEAGCLVLSCSGFVADVHIAYSGLLELVWPIRDLVADLDESSAHALRIAMSLDSEGGIKRPAVAAALMALLSRAAEDRPTVCLIDDEQWLDRCSADAIGFVARRTRAVRLGFVVATRAPSYDFAAARHLAIGPLPAGAARRLVSEERPDLSSAAVEAVVAGASGNPLALVWAARRVSSGPTVPSEIASVDDVVTDLPAHALQVAVVIALDATGDATVIDAAIRRCGFDRAQVERLEDLRLIERSLSSIWVSHPAVRAAIVARASASLCRRVHRELAMCQTGPGSTERATWHLAAAALGPDEALSSELRHVAEESLRRGDPASAAQAFEMSAVLSPHRAAACRALIDAGASAAHAGSDEGDVLDRAAALAESGEEHDDIAVWRCLAATWRGDGSVATRLLDDPAAQTPRSPTADAIIRSCGVGAAFQALDLDRIRRYSSANPLGSAEVSALRGPAVLAAVDNGFVDVLCGDVERGVARLRTVAAVLLAGEGTEAAAPCAFALSWAERYELARELLDSGLAHSDRAGDIASAAWLRTARGDLFARLGDFDAAAGDLRAGLELSDAAGVSFAADTCRNGLALIGAHRGDGGQVAVRTGMADGCAFVRVARSHALGVQALAVGSPRRALDELQRGWDLIRRATGLHPSALPMLADIAEAAVRCGERDLAAEVSQRIDEFLDRHEAPGLAAERARIDVLTCALSDVDDRAARALDAADAQPSELVRGRTRLVVGERLRRAKRRAAAGRALDAARASFEAVGATPWVQRVAHEQLAAGRQGPRGSGPAVGLTAHERHVAELVARGHRNDEIARELFVSVKTIETHLSRIYRKVGVRNRTELTRLVHDGLRESG